MILKEHRRENWFLYKAKEFKQNKGKHFAGIIILLANFVLFGAFLLGVYLQWSGFMGDRFKPFLQRNIEYLPKRLNAIFSNPDIEKITIDIKFKNFMKLAYKREVALANGLLVSSDGDYVEGQIRYKDQTIKVKLRLKGDELDHLQGKKWSFRIKVRGDSTLFGMKRFSIQHPATRKFVREWVMHQVLKKEGLIYHRYKFIEVTLNGDNLGIYALEEHMGKRLIENNQLRNGPILKYNESLTWAELKQQGPVILGHGHIVRPFFENSWNGSGSYNASEINAFQMSKWTADSLSNKELQKAIGLLESFRQGKLTTSEAFDVKKLATYFAVMDLCGAFNGTQWLNIRFYYNPITSRLEPIGRDGSPGELRRLSCARGILPGNSDIFWNIANNQRYFAHLFADRDFYAEYIKEIERLTDSSYLDNLFSEIEDELVKNLLIISKEFPEFLYSKELLYKNQHYMHTVLEPVKGFHAYLEKSKPDGLSLYLGNIQSLPIEILNITCNDFIFQPVKRTILDEKDLHETVKFKQEYFEFPKGFVWADSLISELKINYRIFGANGTRQDAISEWPYSGLNLLDSDVIRQKPNVNQFKFLKTDKSTKEIFIKPGKWEIDHNLIIPGGYRVICGEGTQLSLSNSALILSYSPIEFIGSAEAPIVIQSNDSTGQGLTVMSAEQTSVLDYVIFRNLTNPSQDGWRLTGAVNFYESPVQIYHSQFLSNISEDALNVIRTKFRIDNSTFNKTFSDALDVDFCEGSITNCRFIDIGNDAVDVSGGNIDIQDVYINGTGDKGLSSGEKSRMTVRNVVIQNAKIGVASKDLSEIFIENIQLTGGQIGFAVYQKKPEFGTASISVNKLDLKDFEIPYLVEDKSTMQVDGSLIPPNKKNVADILYGVEYGKSSK